MLSYNIYACILRGKEKVVNQPVDLKYCIDWLTTSYKDRIIAMGGPDELTDVEKASAIAAFEQLGICTQLAEAAAGLGWKVPSSIQDQAIPHLLQGASNLTSRVSPAGGGLRSRNDRPCA